MNNKPKLKVNLHMHSSFSDGVKDIADIFREATNKNLDYFSITDHDNVDSAIYLLNHPTAKCVNGVELTAYLDFTTQSLTRHDSLHILAYDYDIEMIKNKLITWNQQRKKTVYQYCVKLERMGYLVERTTSRSALAKSLVSEGMAQSILEAIHKINEETNFETCNPSITEVLDAIHCAGGIAIWAHPFEALRYNQKIPVSIEAIRQVLDILLTKGLVGIETDYYFYSEEKKSLLRELSGELGIFYSVGTDYHGRAQDSFYLTVDDSFPLLKHLLTRARPSFLTLQGGRTTSIVKKRNDEIYRPTNQSSYKVERFL